MVFLVLSLSLSANNFDMSFSSNEANLLWAIISFRFVSFRFVSFRFVSFRYVTLRYVTLHYISFHFILFYFRALLGLSCWPRRGLGTTASNIYFLHASSIKKIVIGRWARQQLKLRNKYRILRIIRCSLTNQKREYTLNV